MALKVERKVILGHAVVSESGTLYGKPGNQSGKELRIQEWYLRSEGWSSVIRAKSETHRELIAKAMTDAVNNLNVGYSQASGADGRTSLFREAMNNSWDITKVTKPCNTDCSALVSVCVNAAGIKVSKDMYTGNELAILKGTDAFKVFTADKYTHSSEKLVTGDILLGKGHTAIVVATREEYVFDRIMKYDPLHYMNGADVKQLQTRLKELGYLTGKPDGIYGPKTDAAVKVYQKETRLTVDGIVGGDTIRSMGYSWGG